MIKLNTLLLEMSYTEFNLKKEFNDINQHYFGGKLELNFPLLWKTVKGRLGFVRSVIYRNTGKVEIKMLAMNNMHKMSYEQYRNVLAHEMIHVYNIQNGHPRDNHGPYFHHWMYELNKKGFNITLSNEAQLEVDQTVTGVKEYMVYLIQLIPKTGYKDKLMILTTPNNVTRFTNYLKENTHWLNGDVYVVRSWDPQLMEYRVSREPKSATYIDDEFYNKLKEKGKYYIQFEMRRK